MAVFTPIDMITLKSFLNNYDIGEIINFNGILEGIDNTNFKIETSKNYYILTIFENRIQKKDLPFFIELHNHLAKKKFMSPIPIKNNDGQYINEINNKPCVIMSFLNGVKLTKISTNHCDQIGKQLALMHQHTRDFSLSKKNDLNQKNWKNLFEKFRNIKSNDYQYMFKNIDKELDFLEKHWPKNLPSGVIHADIFRDNVFFINDVFSGIIDFYFACNDFFSYELAICINNWCFNPKNIMYNDRLIALITAYNNHRKLTKDEIIVLPILLRGAAMRILLTRLHDQIYHAEGAFVKPKDPIEYYQILEFHQKNKDLKIENI